MCLAVEIHLLCCFQHLEDALLREGRGEDYREIDERRHTVAYGVLEGLDDSLILVLHKVPLVHNYYERLVVALYELEDVHVLSLNAARGVEHEDANVGVLNGADGTHHGVELKVFRHLVLAADAGSVDEVEVETELVEARVDGIACRAGNLRHDVAVLADEGVDDRTFACVWTPNDSETRNAVLHLFLRVGLQLGEHEVEKVARATACCGGDTLRLTQSERIELGSIIYLVVVVGFVGNKHHGEFRATENLRNVLVPIGESGLHVDEEEHKVGLLCGYDHLLADGILEDVVAVDNPSTGVND